MARDTASESAAAAQDKLLEAVQAGRAATLTAVHEWAGLWTALVPRIADWSGRFASLVPKTPEWAQPFTAEVPDVPDLAIAPALARLIGFSEHIWEGQREFNKSLYEAVAPVGRSIFGAAKATVVHPVKAAPQRAKATTRPARAGSTA